VFRQVVAYRWVEGVTDESKAAFRESLAGLRAIPELTSLRFADDSRYFEGNFDVVAVMDFPDFVLARRYVADERHQVYIRDFASKLIGERVVVQHDWAVRDLVGIRHVTVPVSDVAASGDWYARAFGFSVIDATTETVAADAPTADVAMVHPDASIALVLRHDPARAKALAGFDLLTFSVATAEELEAVLERLDAQGVAHGSPMSSDTGVHVDVRDPDALVVRLRTLLP
jgi:catechol 2,3-dioxygenase-like lactoylglutathione lyase family enzyme